MSKPKLFVAGLPHTDGNPEYMSCSYTQKHVKFCNMMLTLDYEVYSLFGEHSEFNATEHIVVTSDEDKLRWFGDYEFQNNFFPITWSPDDAHWKEMNANIIKEIGERIEPGDIICLIAGLCQAEIARAFPNNPAVEYGIGYTGTFSEFKVFESNPHMHWCYGNQHNDNGGFYDAVIPNYFEVSDFELQTTKEDYYLFIGRLIQRKGVEIAVEATRRLGKKLIMAGQGVVENTPGRIVAEDGMVYEGEHIEHIGSVGPADRSKLMGGARATFVPTTYLEPFGGVSIESMLCGTPVIAPDFGVFVETVIPGISGYRFRTIGEAVEAAKLCENLSPAAVRDYAVRNFSTDVVKYKYDDYFSQLQDLYNGGGFYSDWHGDLDLRYGIIH